VGLGVSTSVDSAGASVVEPGVDSAVGFAVTSGCGTASCTLGFGFSLMVGNREGTCEGLMEAADCVESVGRMDGMVEGVADGDTEVVGMVEGAVDVVGFALTDGR
jgi:hypothetical protein